MVRGIGARLGLACSTSRARLHWLINLSPACAEEAARYDDCRTMSDACCVESVQDSNGKPGIETHASRCAE